MHRYAHQDSAIDPEGVPVRHASTVMVVADQPELEVLMVQRNSRVAFGPSAWVFPGGRVDPDDAADHDHVTVGLTDEEASAVLEVPTGGRAWWIAALRETLEEAGLLLGVENTPVESIDRIRADVHDDPTVFIDRLAHLDITVDLSVVHEVARFITPVGPPRRFDARFFVARAPTGQTAHPDAGEVVHHRWISPTQAIEEWQAGGFPMMSVTHRMLECLARYESVDEVLSAATTRRPADRIRVADPEGEYRVLLPGEPGYETADLEIEHGWVRI